MSRKRSTETHLVTNWFNCYSHGIQTIHRDFKDAQDNSLSGNRCCCFAFKMRVAKLNIGEGSVGAEVARPPADNMPLRNHRLWLVMHWSCDRWIWHPWRKDLSRYVKCRNFGCRCHSLSGHRDQSISILEAWSLRYWGPKLLSSYIAIRI